MRYLQNKETSAELLRLVLPLMARQSAAFHPLSYTIWYEHVAGMNPSLSEQLAPRLESRDPLTEDEIYRLHARHVVERDVDTLDRLRQQLRSLLDETAQSAADAGAEVGRFGQALEQRKTELVNAIGSESVRRVVADLVNETVRMQATSRTLSQKLDASSQEVQKLTRELEQAQTEALLDPLSGLKNRRGLQRAVQSIYGETSDLAGAALLVADIDHFKQVNDTYGHVLGDKVIRAVAQAMHSNIKGRDIAARIGGEEFAVLLPGTRIEDALMLAEQLRGAVARGRIRRGERQEHIGGVTISVGVAAGEAGETLDALILRADEAMYAAKHAGRNQVCEASSSQHRVASR